MRLTARFHTPRLVTWVTAAVACAWLAGTPAGAAPLLPGGFEDEVAPFTFAQPTHLRFLPDGRYLVSEKAGRVYLVGAGSKQLIWDGTSLVLGTFDRGLLAAEIDPGFPATRWVYLLYCVDPDSNGVETEEDNWGRLERYWLSADETTLLPASREVLLGTTWADGPVVGSSIHAVGDLAWGSDGTLLVSAGDGAHGEAPDAGGQDPELFEPGRANPDEDIGAFRARMVQSLDGKVLRLDPATGHGLPSNPFWDGDPMSRGSRVYATGLRNAFRFTVRPGTGSSDPADGNPGVVYYGDVGWQAWEEFGAIRYGGADLGWPCYEASYPTQGYLTATPAHDGCGDPPPTPVLPLLTLNHLNPESSDPPGITGSCAIGGVFYQGTRYPPAYQGSWFIADYVEGWIRVLRTDAQDQRVMLLEFASGVDYPVAIDADPTTGDIWYVAILSGEIHHIRFDGVLGAGPLDPAHAGVSLAPPAPNPARGAVRLALTLRREQPVRFTVHDAQGREVWHAAARTQPAGASVLEWPGTDARGVRAPSGLYFARVTAGGEQSVARFVLLR